MADLVSQVLDAKGELVLGRVGEDGSNVIVDVVVFDLAALFEGEDMLSLAGDDPSLVVLVAIFEVSIPD